MGVYRFPLCSSNMRLVLLIACGVALVSQCTAPVSGIEEEPLKREKILFFVSTLTTIVPFTCFTATEAADCVGRKKKRSLIRLDEDNHMDTDLLLDPSQLVQTLEKEDDSPDGSGKLLFTVWKTTITTKTTTSFSTDRAITVSVMAVCTIANVETAAAPAC